MGGVYIKGRLFLFWEKVGKLRAEGEQAVGGRHSEGGWGGQWEACMNQKGQRTRHAQRQAGRIHGVA